MRLSFSKPVFMLLACLLVLSGIGFWLVTTPAVFHALRGQEAALSAGFVADAGRGARLFWVGGCASCHRSEASSLAQADDLAVLLGGGHRLKTPFGTFVVPNISPHPQDGIGAWSFGAFATAMREGVLPDGRHAFPAFPYTSYQRMNTGDLADLFAFLQSLPQVQGRQPEHDLAFPFNLRRGVGMWKWLYLDGKGFTPDPARSALWNRGAYLVNGPGHCAECHSPRDFAGGIVAQRRFAGGPSPEGGAGRVPNLTPHADGLGRWSLEDIEEFLKTGFTPDFDSAGGSMAEVIKNMAHLEDQDRKAMAIYLKDLPPLPKSP
jgi:mono/diheme cytochrome c family protein